jgi:hypothetical protein
MATSVHIPPPLLKALDKKAKKLRVSRNSLIVKAIEKDLGTTAPIDDNGWPVGFFDAIRRGVDDEAAAEFKESMTAVVALRRSKKPIDF